MKHILLLHLVLSVVSSVAQKSIKIDSELSMVTRGQHNLSALVNNFDCHYCTTGKVQDNPLFHLAIYTGVEHKLTLDEKYTLETGLYLEERSHSGGNNTLSNLVWFPKIKISAEDTLKVKGRKWKYAIIGGDFWDEDVSDILRLYNLDYHALRTRLTTGRLTWGFMTIGDLSKNVGLDLHQLYRFDLTYEKNKWKNMMALDINEIFSKSQGREFKSSDINFSNYLKLRLRAQLALEGQLSLRINKNLPAAQALGIKLNYESPKTTFSASVRYYKNVFNQGYNGYKPRYFDGNEYIGPQLYPLKNYYRSLSQWALYTHIQNGDLLALACTLHWESDKSRKLGFFLDLDMNYIHDLTHGQIYIYPIYNSGLQVNFSTLFHARVSLTNKHMELRNFYQTSAVSKVPFLSLGVQMEINKIKLGTRYVSY